MNAPQQTSSLEKVLAQLCAHPSRHVPGSQWMSQAAVAICLRQQSLSSPVEMLMIQRATREGDPWSGHMAFPGGRIESQDPNPLAAAIRECQEEIALDLHTHAAYQGQLSERPAIARVKIKPLVIFPYLFSVAHTPPPHFQRRSRRCRLDSLRFLFGPTAPYHHDLPQDGR